MLFGGHVGGGVKAAPERAEAIGANALQLFVQSPRAWRFPNHDPEVLASFKGRAQAAGMEAWIVHAIYLCNLASPKDEIYAKSVSTLRSTVEAACAIGADGVVFHVGSHLGSGFEAGLDWDEELVRRAAPLVQEKIEKLDQFPDYTRFFFEEVSPAVPLDGAGAVLEQAEQTLAGVEPFEAGAIERELRSLAERLELKPRDAFQPIRIAVTGSKVSPGLFESLELLGRDETLRRLATVRAEAV